MYRIAKINELSTADFVVNDKALTVDSTMTQITPIIVDKEHRSVEYLSAAINVINDAYNRLTTFENTIKTNYFTADLSETYITSGTLIHDDYVTELITIGSKGGFLTVIDANAYKTECLALIQQLKEKAMNMFTANLDTLFKKQQSIDAVPIGSTPTKPDSNGDVTYPGVSLNPELILNNAERWNSLATADDFNMFNGQFSLMHLLTGFTTLQASEDIWHDNTTDDGIFNIQFENIEHLKEQIGALSDQCVYGFCNANPQNNTGNIVIPTESVNTNSNTTQPIATIVFEVLKQQIYVVMKNVYMQYLVKLTAYPNPVNNEAN